MNILFTCAGRRNYLLEYFKVEINNNGSIIAVDIDISAPALAVADKYYKVSSIYKDSYVDEILSICRIEKVDLLISLNDLELPILAESKEKFKNIGTTILISEPKVIDICFDKWKTIEFAKKTGLLSPKTYLSIDNLKEAIEKYKLTFPLVIKPRWGSASIGIEFPRNLEELELGYKLVSLKIKDSILAVASSSEIEYSLIIQEKIEGKEYGLDILNNFEGKPVQVYVKEKLAMRAGETDKAVLRENPVLEKLGFYIGEKLGHIGNLDCDIFEKEGKYYILEMNPRFGGGYPFTQMAGGNYPEAIVSWVKSNNYDFTSFKRNYNQIFSKCDTIIPVRND